MKRLFLGLLLLLPVCALAQETAAKAAPTNNPQAAGIHAAYKVDVAVSEIENGKTVGSRSYTLNVADTSWFGSDWGRLRYSSRVPVANGHADQITYADTGVNIDARLREAEAGLVLDLTVEMDVPAGQVKVGEAAYPVFRKFRYNTTTLVTPGKPALMNATDDVNAPGRVQIEATVTKIK